MRKLFILLIAAVVFMPIIAGAQATSTTSTTPASTSSGAGQVDVGGNTGGVDVSNLSLGIPGSNEGSDPASMVANLYEFALLLGGVLAFGSIVYGGIQYLMTAGNTSAQHEAKDRIRDALIGLLLLIGVYFVMNIISPDLTKLRFPEMKRLSAPVQTPQFGADEDVWGCWATEGKETLATCWKDEASCNKLCEDYVEDKGLDTGVVDDWKCTKVKGAACNTARGVPSGPITNAACAAHAAAHPGANSCSDSPGTAKVKACVKANMPKLVDGVNIYTFQGSHAANSCHFGGRTCLDGSHALDVGKNGALANNKNLQEAKAIVEACGRNNGENVTCYYEDPNGKRLPYGDSTINHIHCNINTGGSPTADPCQCM